MRISDIAKNGILSLKSQAGETIKDKPGNWHKSWVIKGNQ